MKSIYYQLMNSVISDTEMVKLSMRLFFEMIILIHCYLSKQP